MSAAKLLAIVSMQQRGLTLCDVFNLALVAEALSEPQLVRRIALHDGSTIRGLIGLFQLSKVRGKQQVESCDQRCERERKGRAIDVVM